MPRTLDHEPSDDEPNLDADDAPATEDDRGPDDGDDGPVRRVAAGVASGREEDELAARDFREARDVDDLFDDDDLEPDR